MHANYLPLFLNHKIDFHFNGHEHALEHVTYRYSDLFIFDDKKEQFKPKGAPRVNLECLFNQEMFFNSKRELVRTYKKGEAIH